MKVCLVFLAIVAVSLISECEGKCKTRHYF